MTQQTTIHPDGKITVDGYYVFSSDKPVRYGFGEEILNPELVALRRRAWQAMRPKSTRTHRGWLLRQASDPVLAQCSAPLQFVVPTFSSQQVRRR